MTILNFNTLLKPINRNNPCGKNLRQDSSPQSIYYRMKDARKKARAMERLLMQGSEGGSAKKEWQCVYTLAIAQLENETKDLEITAWLIEALLRLYGFEGLKEGFLLTRELIENFWELRGEIDNNTDKKRSVNCFINIIFL